MSDEHAGLQRLSEQTRLGIAPTVANFANWIPTADGVEIHFAKDEPGVQLPQIITVPWPALNDVLAPGMVELAQD